MHRTWPLLLVLSLSVGALYSQEEFQDVLMNRQLVCFEDNVIRKNNSNKIVAIDLENFIRSLSEKQGYTDRTENRLVNDYLDYDVTNWLYEYHVTKNREDFIMTSKALGCSIPFIFSQIIEEILQFKISQASVDEINALDDDNKSLFDLAEKFCPQAKEWVSLRIAMIPKADFVFSLVSPRQGPEVRVIRSSGRKKKSRRS